MEKIKIIGRDAKGDFCEVLPTMAEMVLYGIWDLVSHEPINKRIWYTHNAARRYAYMLNQIYGAYRYAVRVKE